ncbi:uncharacterized protein RAG0_05003 [Rhynchosporium agropyri]|uniref:Uncharacterized protein n=1 Tax=Rhynchosporium agropyri TaxID=914238 RepID=A0A1E1KB29_9HELO|nr:uncharacterized protein RAG0_05003 [Rhynchosporium agropyri]
MDVSTSGGSDASITPLCPVVERLEVSQLNKGSRKANWRAGERYFKFKVATPTIQRAEMSRTNKVEKIVRFPPSESNCFLLVARGLEDLVENLQLYQSNLTINEYEIAQSSLPEQKQMYRDDEQIYFSAGTKYPPIFLLSSALWTTPIEHSYVRASHESLGFRRI